MNVFLIILFISVCFCIVVSALIYGKVERLEVTMQGQFASVAKQIVKQKEAQNKFEIDLAVLGGQQEELDARVHTDCVALRKRIEEIEEHEPKDERDMENRVIERLEEKWDNGLQAILNFNPFAREDDE